MRGDLRAVDARVDLDESALAARQRLEGQHWMVEFVTHRHELTLGEQKIIDRILVFQNVDVDQQVGKRLAHVGYGAWHHDVGDARGRSDLELDIGSALDSRNNKLQILDLGVHAVDLIEDGIGLPRRAVAAAFAAKQLYADGHFRVLHHAADPGRGNIE